MSVDLKLFGSPDSKYFIRTANRILLVPVLTCGLLAYSLWLYLDMNYYFFTSKGFAVSGDFKDVFIDHLVAGQVDLLPWVGLFFIMVYFLGLFLAHLVLRPFKIVAQMCRETMDGQFDETLVRGFTKHQLVVKASLLLTDFIQTRDHTVPPELAKITGPKMDFVFYFQYALCMAILFIITAAAIYVGIHHLHDSIIGSAHLFLKTDAQIASFLQNQQETVTTMAYMCIGFSFVLYAVIANGVIRSVEGVSYAYLRDARKVVEGDYARRLQPRFKDPGTEGALALNALLEHYFPNRAVAEEGVAPPETIPTPETAGAAKIDQKSIQRLFGKSS